MQNPFEIASKKEKTLKIMLWGKWGVGKTTTALKFPKPCLLDLDGGAELYGKKFSYSVKKTTNLMDIKNAIHWLAQNNINDKGEKTYETLILDPITVYWDILQKHWSDYFKEKKGKKKNREFADFGPKEWNTVKNDYDNLLKKLNDLNINIVVTARETTQYKANEFMVVDGVKPDCEKKTPYAFDIILNLFIDNGDYYFVASKDRSGKIEINQKYQIDKIFDLLKIKENYGDK